MKRSLIALATLGTIATAGNVFGELTKLMTSDGVA